MNNAFAMPPAPQMVQAQPQNAPFNMAGSGSTAIKLPHIDDLEKKILDIRSMAGEPKTGIDSHIFDHYNEVIKSNQNSNVRFEPCKFVYYMYEVGNSINDAAYDEDSANQKAQLEIDLDNIRQNPKTTSAELNIATNLCVRAVKGIKNLKNHIKPDTTNPTLSPSIFKKLEELEEKKKKIEKDLKQLEQNITVSNNQFIDMKLKQKGLYRKLLNILHKVECVRKLTTIVDDRERQMEEKLVEIERNLRGPFTDIQLLASMKGTTSVGGRSNIEINDARIDKDSLKKILELLEPQRQGLEHLSNVTKKDNYHADEMINKIKSVKINL